MATDLRGYPLSGRLPCVGLIELERRTKPRDAEEGEFNHNLSPGRQRQYYTFLMNAGQVQRTWPSLIEFYIPDYSVDYPPQSGGAPINYP